MTASKRNDSRNSDREKVSGRTSSKGGISNLKTGLNIPRDPHRKGSRNSLCGETEKLYISHFHQTNRAMKPNR